MPKTPVQTPEMQLNAIAKKAMTEYGLLNAFPADAMKELNQINGPLDASDGKVRNLRELPWCSIDNDDSRDLDQLSCSQPVSKDSTRILIAIADVDSHVLKGSKIDGRAKHNTTSVYCPTVIFNMLPEKLSYGLTSLNEGEDRMAMVTEMEIGRGGVVKSSSHYRAIVRNKAKLTYSAVGAWLEGRGPVPEKVTSAGLEEQLIAQDKVAQKLRLRREEEGALDLETIEARAVLANGHVVDLQASRKNRAHELIEDFMIAANGATARFLVSKGFPTFRRIVREPERWLRIVALARELDERLPEFPDSKALEAFLIRRRQADPLRFPDLSLSIVKLMGRGEYAVQLAGQPGIGHFGLAVKDYSHSTAPNRRYPDVITQRLLKAAIAGRPSPYGDDEIVSLAKHCSDQENAANKVERRVYKSAAAQLLLPQVGRSFDALVTGASNKGTWVRVLHPPVEGRLTRGFKKLEVGQLVRVKLVSVDVERGYIDFEKTKG
jgi:exoribonuclease-2